MKDLYDSCGTQFYVIKIIMIFLIFCQKMLWHQWHMWHSFFGRKNKQIDQRKRVTPMAAVAQSMFF
jgi:hypothetical protein